MRFFAVLLAPFLLAAPLAAQEFGDDWEVIGTFLVTLGEEETAFYAVRDKISGQSTLKRTKTDGVTVIQAAGVVPDGDAEPGLPILAFDFGGFYGAHPYEATIELREAERVLMAGENSETNVVLSNVSLLESGEFTFDFSAELAVMSPLAEGGFEPAVGAIPLTIEGTFSGTVRDQ